VGSAIVDQHRRSVAWQPKPRQDRAGHDGSDFAPFGNNAQELELLVDAGLKPIDALRAGTSVAAEALGIDGFTGSIATGKAADLLVVDGNPLDDVRILRDLARIKRVYLGGKLVVDRDAGIEATRRAARSRLGDWPAEVAGHSAAGSKQSRSQSPTTLIAAPSASAPGRKVASHQASRR
jgi:hypothetical protein